MKNKYFNVLRRMALDGTLDEKTAEYLVDAGKWDESQHPRGKGGKFAPKGSGKTGGGGQKESEAVVEAKGVSGGASEKKQAASPTAAKGKKKEVPVDYEKATKGLRGEQQKLKEPSSSGFPSKSEREKIKYDRLAKNEVEPHTKRDLEGTLKMAYGSRDPDGKAFYEDLKWVSEAGTRDEFVQRAEKVHSIWEKKSELSDGDDGPWRNPNEELGFALEREKDNQSQFEKLKKSFQESKSPTNYPRKPDKGSGEAGEAAAKRITEAGEASLKSKVAKEDSGSRFAGEGKQFQEGSAFNKPKAGRPTKELTKGTGATKLSVGDLYDEKHPFNRHTINQYLDDDGNLTPEREELHAQAVENLFVGKKPTEPGKKKTFTMFGGGSAAGKGGLSDPARCGDFKSSFFTNGTPSKDSVATIDSDELKKDIPEYREMQESDPDNAAAIAHEESSAMAKRAMQAAFDNGYDCTLDGTGDGSVEGVLKKIKQARDRGYEVNACYVTCPTQMAVDRAEDRAKRTKRNVRTDTVKSIHREVSRIFPQVASEFDHVALFDTAQGKPVLIAECERGGEIKVLNQKLYDAFLAKGNE